MSKTVSSILREMAVHGAWRGDSLYIALSFEQIVVLIGGLEKLEQGPRIEMMISTLRDMMVDPAVMCQTMISGGGSVVMYADCLKLDAVVRLVSTNDYDVLEATETPRVDTGHT